jgi:diguanylate cyclase (GGDEF)-like protein/PAS domain S-box-containing protein
LGAQLYAGYRTIGTVERERLQSYGKIAADNLGHQLRSTGNMVKTIRSELPYLSVQKEGVTLVNRHLKSMSEVMQGVRTLLVLDAMGTVSASNRAELIGQNFHERAYFRIAQQEGNPDTLYVSPPFKTVLGVFTVTLAMVITDENGAFSGIVGVTLDPEYFNTLLDSIRYVPDVRASIVHSDGTVFVNSPQLPGVDGKNLANPDTFFTRHHQSGQLSSLYTGTVYATGDERMMHQRTVEINGLNLDRPFVLAISRDLPTIFADWRADAFTHAGGFLLLVLITSSGLYLYQKRQRNFDHHLSLQEVERKQSEEALRLSEKRHRLVTDNAKDVIWTMSPEGAITYISPSIEAMRGFSPAEAMQQTIEEIHTPASQAISQGYFTQLFADLAAGRPPQSFRGELEYRCKDGSTVWTEVMAQPILGVDGSVVEILGVTRDISERKRAEELVRELAYYDPLTGLANRMLLNDRLTQSMLSGERSGHYGALIFLDMDNFKPLNDQYGHGVGDLLLAEVAKRLKSCVRQIDTVARFGGDEFVVLLDDLTSDKEQAHAQADLVAGKIRSLLADPYLLKTVAGDFGVPQTVEHKCTASIGVALFLGRDNTGEEILKWADLAMYNAKEAGRNTVCFCDAQMWNENTTRQILEKDLHDAVLKNQFCIYFQAQFDRQNHVIGADALLRWQHPSRGWVSPREFIPKAERTGLILPMGLWVLESACLQLAMWAKRAETADLTVTVNVSGRQLVQRDFVEQVTATLARTGAKPQRLKLELKESVLIADVESFLVKINALKDKGIGISLDDFGKGYSSLSGLNRLPLDQIKIDQDFVRDILTDPDDAAVAKMVVALADSMEVAVIAEGVETQAQRDFLATLGCNTYQGHLLSPALPAQEFEELLARLRA